MLARALQTSPEGLTARAKTVSAPGPSLSTRRVSKEPLRPAVVPLVRARTLPSRRSVTFQVTPLRF
jgi:hypothetical protein